MPTTARGVASPDRSAGDGGSFADVIDFVQKRLHRAVQGAYFAVEEEFKKREGSSEHRRYRESTFHKICYITIGQRAGFSLEEIAEQLAILPNIHPIPPKDWEPLRKKWEQRIDQNIAELKQLKIDLKRCARDASR